MQISVVNWKGGVGKSTIALSLLDVLKAKGFDASIVEHDIQRMVGRASDLGARHQPVAWEKANTEYVIHDLPPYNTDTLLAVLRVSNHIIVPLKVSDNDKLCTVDLINYLIENRLIQRATIVFNEVRKPYTLVYKDVKRSLQNNFSDVKIAGTELSDLRGVGGFKTILRSSLKGKARDQILALAKELGILRNI